MSKPLFKHGVYLCKHCNQLDYYSYNVALTDLFYNEEHLKQTIVAFFCSFCKKSNTTINIEQRYEANNDRIK